MVGFRDETIATQTETDYTFQLKMSLRKSSITRIPVSRNTLGRNSLQNENPSIKCRRSSSLDARARGSGGVPFKPRSMSEERKSLYHSSRKSSLTFNECKTIKDQRPLADKAYQRKKILELVEIVRVQYFVRGGFVGHRSRASSKHLYSHLPVDGVRFLGGQKGLRCSCKMHVWVSGSPKISTAAGSGYVTALALSYRTFLLRKV
ncbi:putative kinetochore protein NDC80 [Trichonephila clavipes]|nr:putative kinetochore protein NDC80 [Trichonephila clavipes]